MSNLNPQQFAEQTWYHSGEHPLKSGAPQVHVGTHAAATQRTDPRKWDPPEEFPEIGHAKLYEVRLRPETKVASRIFNDDNEAGSLGFKLSGADAVPYKNTYEDPGNVSMVVNPKSIASVRRVRDPHAPQRRNYRKLAE
jgi:hypothetical protein